MAAADYHLCDNCGCKTFYDAELHYDDDGKLCGVGDMAALCDSCSETHEVKIVEK